MKIMSRVVNLTLIVFVVLTLAASVGSLVTGKPFIFSAIRSNSMYPLFERGDMIIIKSVDNGNINVGDIIVFKSEEGSLSSQGWIAHRIIGGNAKEGYITKGDANKKSDQDSGETVPIKPEWIVSKVIAFEEKPLKIPIMGHLPLWMDKYKSNPFILPGIAIMIAVVIGVNELTSSHPKKKQKTKLELQLVYLFGGLTLSLVAASTMLLSSNHVNLTYEVSESSKGVIMGSGIGIMKTGDRMEKPLSKLKNNGIFPLVFAAVSDDSQVSFSENKSSLNPGDSVEVNFRIHAVKPGKYNSSVWMGLFYPFLPRNLIYILAQHNFFLAIILISLIPGLPIILYPFLDKTLRVKTFKEVRKLKRKMQKYLIHIK